MNRLLLQNKHLGRIVLIGLVGVMLLISTLNNASGSVKTVGYITLAALLYLANLFLVAKIWRTSRFKTDFLSIAILSATFALSYMVGVAVDGTHSSVVMLAQVLALIGFFLAASLHSWSDGQLRILGVLVLSFFLANALIWVVEGSGYRFRSYMSNENVFGGVVFALLYLPIASRCKPVQYVSIVLGVGLAIVAGARSAWLAILATAFTFWAWNWITYSRKRYFLFFACLLFGSLSFVYVYSHHFLFSRIAELNQLVFLYTEQNMLSGRQNFWWALVELIMRRPFFGHGAGIIPADMFHTDLSSHNLFIQTALQVGLVGLTLLIALLAKIWHILWKGRDEFLPRLTGAFLVGIIVHQTFEVSLTQVGLSIGVVYWLMMGIGVSISLKKGSAATGV